MRQRVAHSDRHLRPGVAVGCKSIRICAGTSRPSCTWTAIPGGYGVIQLLNGHKSIDTTTSFYCGAETGSAIRHYDQHILKLRDDASPLLLKRRR